MADHLLIPVGRPKWSIECIKITGVSSTATYFQSDTPLVHIDRGKQTAVRLRNFRDVFPDEVPLGLERDDSYSFVPENMVKVDFAFWTGRSLIAVEIDGSSHFGREAHIQRDRMLQRAGVMVIHVLNSELLKVDDIVAATARARELGAGILEGSMKLGDFGGMSVLVTPTGGNAGEVGEWGSRGVNSGGRALRWA
jgi:Protein of unknown function (DUF559)